MSRKTKKQEVIDAAIESETAEMLVQVPEAIEAEAAPETVPTAEEGDLDALMAEVDDDEGFGIIKRRMEGESDLKYLARWKISQISLENIKQQFGGGVYDVAIRNKGGQLMRRARFSIDEGFKGRHDSQNASNSVLSEMTRGNRSDPMLPLMMQMMQQQAAQQMQMMQAMMTSNAQIIGSVMGRANSGGSGGIPPELLKVLLDKSSPESTIKMMRDLKELLPDSGGYEREDDGFMGKLMSAAPAMISALAGGAAAAQQRSVVSAPPQRLMAPPPVTVEPAPPAPGAPPAGMSGLLPAEIKSLLLKAAERDADEVLYADLIIDQISPEGVTDELVEMLTNDAAFYALIGDVPAPLIPWFQKLRVTLVTPNEEEEPAPAPAPAPAPTVKPVKTP